jgi:Na+/melibiose symporter-like transporter
MGLEQIIPAIFLIAVLVLVLPSFLRSNSKFKQFTLNLIIWSIIIVTVMIVSYLIIQ